MELTISQLIKIILGVFVFVVVVLAVGFYFQNSFRGFTQGLPSGGDSSGGTSISDREVEIAKPKECKELGWCRKKTCEELNQEWKEYYAKKEMSVVDKCCFEVKLIIGMCKSIEEGCK